MSGIPFFFVRDRSKFGRWWSKIDRCCVVGCGLGVSVVSVSPGGEGWLRYDRWRMDVVAVVGLLSLAIESVSVAVRCSCDG